MVKFPLGYWLAISGIRPGSNLLFDLLRLFDEKKKDVVLFKV